MKKLLLIFAVFGFIASTSSCAKCITCRNADQKQKLCDKDWDGTDQKDVINYYEALGWDCKKSSDTY